MVRKTLNIKYYEAVGRRKSSVARVRLYITRKEITVGGIKMGQSDVYVNKKPIGEYFPGEVARLKYELPLKLTNNDERFAISIQLGGGGKSGQLTAVTHGLARAIEKVDKDFRPVLKKHGLLTRDARIRERRKVGTGGRARRKKQSPKR